LEINRALYILLSLADLLESIDWQGAIKLLDLKDKLAFRYCHFECLNALAQVALIA